ncbi:hypothetical protein [Pseudidiomarina gelatinasegens]|uniref:hypothetical protein n=1 Tax=Pseudidiomarina gelatinasegens TaxID=2487740 RepID=UPI003A96DE29
MRKVIVSDRSYTRFFKRDFARGIAIKRFAALIEPKMKDAESSKDEDKVVVIVGNYKTHG